MKPIAKSFNPETAARIRGLPLFLQYVYRRFLRDRCLEAAGSLTFTTLLALVPVTFIGLAVLSAFPVFDDVRVELQEFVFRNFVPEVGAVALEHLNRFATNAGRISTAGIAGLAVTALILLISIEAAFNAIWRVTEPRPLVWRMVSFWAVLTVGPLLIGASLSISSEVFSAAGPPTISDRSILDAVVTQVLPPILEFTAFALVYVVIPNRPVRVVHALIGAAVAAGLLEVLRLGFALYVALTPSFQTIYGAMAVFIVFLLWLYIAWTVALFGAVITASLAEWGARRELVGRPHLSPGGRLSVALALLAELHSASKLGVIRRRKDLLRNMNLGAFVVEAVLEDLAKGKYITRVARDQWVLARDLDHATVYDFYWDLNLGVGTDPFRWMRPTHWQPAASAMIDEFDERGRESMSVTLKDLFAQQRPTPTKAESPATESEPASVLEPEAE